MDYQCIPNVVLQSVADDLRCATWKVGPYNDVFLHYTATVENFRVYLSTILKFRYFDYKRYRSRAMY